MASNIESSISRDWDSLAIDDGSFLVSQNGYRARLEDRNGNVINSEVDRIRYSPKINTAPSATLTVEPLSELEDTDFLGGTVDLFVDGDILFAGEIVNIETSQQEGEWYSVKAESPGRKLTDEVIDETADNHVLADFMTKTVDKYNNFDDEHFNMTGTADESLTDVDSLPNNARKVSSTVSSGTATYSSVGSDASNIAALYVKLNIDTDTKVTIDTNNSSYSETFNTSKGNEYGTWRKIEPSGLNSESYDIKFEMSGSGTHLYDWISLTEEVVQRKSEGISVDSVDTGLTVQNADSTSEWESVLTDIADSDPIAVNNGDFELLQSSYFRTTDDRDNQVGTERGQISNAEQQDAWVITDNGDYILWDIPSLDYKFLNDNIGVAVRSKTTFNDGSTTPVPDVKLNGTTIGTLGPGSDFSWDKIDVGNSSFSDDLAKGDMPSIKVEQVTSDEYEVEVDVAVLYDTRYSYNFDDSTDDSTDLLAGPEDYPDIHRHEASPNTLVDNISSATADITSNTTDGNEIQISFDSGSTWQPSDGSETSTNSITVSKKFPGRSLRCRLGLTRYGSGASSSPTEGYNGQKIDDYTLKADTDDLEVIFNQDFKENRLATISGLGDESTIIFRWEGNLCRIFKSGSRTTNVSLVESNVESSVDIEDTYASVEVIGKNGVTSGVVNADNPPSYVNAHREIRDRQITKKEDADRRARAFLADNSSVEYSGTIETLPTRVPVGEEIDGSVFAHGQNSIIKSADYGKRKTTVDAGKIKNLGSHLISIDRETTTSSIEGT